MRSFHITIVAALAATVLAGPIVQRQELSAVAAPESVETPLATIPEQDGDDNEVDGMNLKRGTTPNDFQSTILAQHNKYRALHSAPALVWDSDLAAQAQRMVAPCVFAHKPCSGAGCGQNLAAGTNMNGIGAVDMWYDESKADAQRKAYPYGAATADYEVYGHFTQLVWKSSTKLGCATQACSGNSNMVFCNYRTPGNYANEFATNVLRPKRATV